MRSLILHNRFFSKKILTISAKLCVILVLFWILYVQLFQNNDLTSLISQFNQSMDIDGNWVYLVLAICLMPINWLLEGKKWATLVNQFQSFTFTEALKSILAGISLAIMTPGRIGEYGGRLVGIKSSNRPKAIVANLISSLSQNSINIGVGMIGALLFLQYYMPMHQSVFASLIFLGLGVTLVLLLIYFRIDLLSGIVSYLPQWKWVVNIKNSIASFEQMSFTSLTVILGISFVRFCIYVSQYVMLIYFFGVTHNLIAAVLGVITVFFLQSNLPLPPALSVLARGEMAIFLWSVFTTNVLGILAASFSLWIINLVVPALLGTIIISQVKLFED